MYMNNTHSIKGNVISDVNIDLFARIVNNDEAAPEFELSTAPYGQVYQSLLKFSSQKQDKQFAFIWTHPEILLNNFAKACQFENFSMTALQDEIEEFSEKLLNFSSFYEKTFFVEWVLPCWNKGLGPGDINSGSGLRFILNQARQILYKNLLPCSRIVLLDPVNWFIETGLSNVYDTRLWYSGKIPYTKKVLKIAAEEFRHSVNILNGNAKKVLLLDLDDTLWGGIVGEVGWENLNLGGHSAVGEAMVEFQKSVKALKNRGVILGIVSKNEESIALQAIQDNPEMILKIEDFSVHRINWQSKSHNILSIVDELNVGLDSVVFIDDNAHERDHIKSTLADVTVPDWPQDKTQYVMSLSTLRCFDTLGVVDEDRVRTDMYQDRKKRESAKTQVASIETWLNSLDTVIVIEKLNSKNLLRSQQLMNKTNQMNLSTRRMTDQEILRWAQCEENQFWTVRIRDKFGDLGISGIISCTAHKAQTELVDFVLSCRVIGRKIEETMINFIIGYTQNQKTEKLSIKYLKTSRNNPCRLFFDELFPDNKINENEYLIEYPFEVNYPMCLSLEIK